MNVAQGSGKAEIRNDQLADLTPYERAANSAQEMWNAVGACFLMSFVAAFVALSVSRDHPENTIAGITAGIVFILAWIFVIATLYYGLKISYYTAHEQNLTSDEAELEELKLRCAELKKRNEELQAILALLLTKDQKNSDTLFERKIKAFTESEQETAKK
jgi:Na+/melibiose symporter-like transporter